MPKSLFHPLKSFINSALQGVVAISEMGVFTTFGSLYLEVVSTKTRTYHEAISQ